MSNAFRTNCLRISRLEITGQSSQKDFLKTFLTLPAGGTLRQEWRKELQIAFYLYSKRVSQLYYSISTRFPT